MNPYTLNIGQIFADQTAAAMKAVETQQQRGRDLTASHTRIPTTQQIVHQATTVNVLGDVMKQVQQQQHDMITQGYKLMTASSKRPSLASYGLTDEYVERLRRTQQVHDTIRANTEAMQHKR